MKFQLKSLISKVSKRIFGLFMLSALIPILTIYLVSYNQILERLDNESRRQLYRESRSLGLAVYDRLLSIETNIKIIANELKRGTEHDAFEQDEWLESIFTGIYIQEENGSLHALFGVPVPIKQFSAEQKAHLKKTDDNTLFFISNENQQTLYFLVYPLESGRYLVSQINETYLWNFPIYSPEFACAFVEPGRPLYCTSLIKDYGNEISFTEQDFSSNNAFGYLLYDKNEYAANSWGIFLKAKFFSEDIFILVASPRTAAFIAFNDFKSSFPKILIITGLLIALISISQIRKTLTPLQKLAEGADRIKKGDYNTPVEIKSKDEFEGLADSFNRMARHIDEQFKTMSTLANIDRLILSSLETGYIIETLIRHLHNIIRAEHVSVITFNEEDSTRALLHINKDKDFKLIEQKEITFSQIDLEELETCKSYLYIKADSDRNYVKPFSTLGDEFLLVFPIHIKDTLSGAVCLGFKHELADENEKTKQIRELCDRVAVALANAMWEEKLYFQAHYDSLTKLPNRFLFQDRLEQAIARALSDKRMVAVLFLDLDRFKDINDTLGHVSGDLVLKKVAQAMSKQTKTYDTMARWGGDEFVLFISDIDGIDNAVNSAKQLSMGLLQSMEDAIPVKSRETYITTSIGIAIYPDDGDNYHDLLKNADAAMYVAKEKGRNNYQFYQQAAIPAVLDKLEIIQGLKHAAERNELRLYYQPKISCRTGKLIGSEALLRWQHPQKGLIYPESFITHAEETGLLNTLSHWVLEAACTNQKALHDSGADYISVAINLSSEQFKQPELHELISDTLVRTGLDPRHLELEITESVAIEDFQKTVETLRKLKELGISISIDDFGTGYSSLSYLQQFPIDKLKIDPVFIGQLPENKNSATIVKAIIALAHSLKLDVIAEGVETQQQCEFLIEAGCDEIQGYIIAQPLAVENFRLFVLRENALN